MYEPIDEQCPLPMDQKESLVEYMIYFMFILYIFINIILIYV